MLSLKLSNLSLTGRFRNISILLILSLITSMAFVRKALLVIFPFSLILGPPLFGILVNLLLFLWTYLKPSIQFGRSIADINRDVPLGSVQSPTFFYFSM